MDKRRANEPCDTRKRSNQISFENKCPHGEMLSRFFRYNCKRVTGHVTRFQISYIQTFADDVTTQLQVNTHTL